jgi:hypothetical protein
MIDIEEILASVGISGGVYAFYKVARRLYEKYYIDSSCRHPTDNSTDLVVHISRINEHQEKKEEPNAQVEMNRV